MALERGISSFRNNYLRTEFDSESVTARSGDLVRHSGSRGLRTLEPFSLDTSESMLK